MSICHRRKLIFVHIPKNAGTSIFSHFNSLPESILSDQSWKQYSLFFKEWENYTTFSIIRDPYCRFKSFYKFLRIGSNINRFAEIVRDNISNMILTRPQCYYICDNDKVVVDKILKYENLEEELESIGIFSIPKKNVSKIIADEKLIMNDQTIGIINEIYKKDFEILKYEYR